MYSEFGVVTELFNLWKYNTENTDNGLDAALLVDVEERIKRVLEKWSYLRLLDIVMPDDT